MPTQHKTLLSAALVLSASLLVAFATLKPKKPRSSGAVRPPVFTKNSTPRIQVALLLDISGSMEGLIDQARTQLWDMVNLLGKAECQQGRPKIEIALYSYGGNDPNNGYIRQLSPFTTDLDSLSKILFALGIEGSDEYCPQVILKSTRELQWDTAKTTYRAIFIAGNETFRQGPVTWMEACRAARAKGIRVNTIYCGDKQDGITEFWNLAGECGTGSYTNINQNAKLDDIATPYDSALMTLNGRLNGTMIAYGTNAGYYSANVSTVDQLNFTTKKSMLKRTEVKANKNLYRNDSWELVDAYESDKNALAKIDRKTLPDSLKNFTVPQLQAFAASKLAQRDSVRNEIGRISKARGEWLEQQRKANTNGNEATLETEVERIIRNQVRANGYNIRAGQ